MKENVFTICAINKKVYSGLLEVTAHKLRFTSEKYSFSIEYSSILDLTLAKKDEVYRSFLKIKRLTCLYISNGQEGISLWREENDYKDIELLIEESKEEENKIIRLNQMLQIEQDNQNVISQNRGFSFFLENPYRLAHVSVNSKVSDVKEIVRDRFYSLEKHWDWLGIASYSSDYEMILKKYVEMDESNNIQYKWFWYVDEGSLDDWKSRIEFVDEMDSFVNEYFCNLFDLELENSEHWSKWFSELSRLISLKEEELYDLVKNRLTDQEMENWTPRRVRNNFIKSIMKPLCLMTCSNVSIFLKVLEYFKNEKFYSQKRKRDFVISYVEAVYAMYWSENVEIRIPIDYYEKGTWKGIVGTSVGLARQIDDIRGIKLQVCYYDDCFNRLYSYASRDCSDRKSKKEILTELFQLSDRKKKNILIKNNFNDFDIPINEWPKEKVLAAARKSESEGNYAEAFRFYSEAARRKDIQAIFKVGYFYNEGEGVERNISKAREYYWNAAWKKHPIACNNLGVIYAAQHTTYERDQAIEWFKKAIEYGGCNMAYYNLGFEYYKRGFTTYAEKNVVRGYMSEASKRGIKSADEFIKEHFSGLKSKEDINCIYFQDIVIVSGAVRCTNKGHKVESLIAEIYKVKKDGAIVLVVVPAAYCYDCGHYLILKRDIEKISLDGKLLCQFETLDENTNYSNSYSDWNQESLIRKCGYNVNQQENLSVKQRRAILERVVEAGIMSPTEICGLLDSFIDIRVNQPNMKTAIGKWREDRNYIMNYNKNQRKLIAVRYQ